MAAALPSFDDFPKYREDLADELGNLDPVQQQHLLDFSEVPVNIASGVHDGFV
jgi:hypothetical protein